MKTTSQTLTQAYEVTVPAWPGSLLFAATILLGVISITYQMLL